MGKAGNKRNPDVIHASEQYSSCLLLRRLTWQPHLAYHIEPCSSPPLSQTSSKDLQKPQYPLALCHHTPRRAVRLVWDELALQLYMWSQSTKTAVVWHRGVPLDSALSTMALFSPATFVAAPQGKQRASQGHLHRGFVPPHNNPITAMLSWILKRLPEKDGLRLELHSLFLVFMDQKSMICSFL